MTAKRGAYTVWVGHCERERPFGKKRHRREDNIKMDQDVRWGHELD
jgi:hypothetical protein